MTSPQAAPATPTRTGRPIRITSGDLWWAQRLLGRRAFLRNVDLYRLLEYPASTTALAVQPGDVLLDIGSGTSLWPWLISQRGARVICADIDQEKIDRQVPIIRDRLHTAVAVRVPSSKFQAPSQGYWTWHPQSQNPPPETHPIAIQNSEFTIQNSLIFPNGVTLCYDQADATCLPYPSKAFERVSCISVIEHVPAPDDLAVMRELGRVLKPGGRLVMTFPYGPRYREAAPPYFDRDHHRIYDVGAIAERLARASGLRLAERQYFGSHGFDFEYALWRRLPSAWFRWAGWTSPLFAGLAFATTPWPGKYCNGALALFVKDE